MLKRTSTVWASALLLLALTTCAQAQSNTAAAPNSFQPARASAATAPAAPADSERVRDGLLGPVRRVRTETAKLLSKNGSLVEQPRVLLEVAAYDLKGAKIENAYFPLSGETLTGKESYKYDEKGNISEMTLQNTDGTLLSKETYAYEYDMVGNWTRMTTNVAVVSGGKLSFEPVEVTYRTITYYLDENLAKMVQPAAAPSPSTTPAAVGPTSKSAASNPQPAPQLPAAVTVDKSKMIAGTDVVAAAPASPGSASAGGNSSPVVNLNAEPPAAVSPAPKPLLKPVSGGVLNGKALDLPKPAFPEAARRMRAGGVVNVEVILDENGKVISARATSGDPLLREAAVRAALRARFSPTKISGQPVKVSGNITYTFTVTQ
jgi:TonB family protein